MGQDLRPEEERARRVIEHACGARVAQFDDGSSDSMYDLQIHYADGQRGAVEVTADADGDSIALWRLLNDSDERWIEPQLSGGWLVGVEPSARAKRLRAELPSFLSELEQLGVREIHSPDWRLAEDVRVQMAELGVASAYQGGTDFPGSIYPTIDLPSERSGGMVSNNGDATASWVEGFLRDPVRADVLDKLRASGFAERHAFLILAPFATAPYEALHPLMDRGTALPTFAPDLPAEVTHVWVMSSWTSGSGYRWNTLRGWEHFDPDI